MTQGDDVAPPALVGQTATTRNTAADWAAVTALTADFTSRAARLIGRALLGQVGRPEATMLGRDTDAVRAALGPLEQSTRQSAWKLSPLSASTDPASLLPALNTASQSRGVDLRLVLDVGAVGRPIAATDNTLRDRVRVAPVQTQLLLVDGRRVVASGPVLHPGRGASGWLLQDDEVVAAALALWDATWQRSTPLPQEALVMTARQRAVAAGLVAGETDAAIARKLRVSVRTVAAEVRFLMDALGASSRYQASVRLHRS